MKVNASQLRSLVVPESTFGKIAQFPLIRSIEAILFLAVAVGIHNIFTIFVLEKIPQPLFSYLLDVETLLTFALLLFAFRLYVKHVERRRAFEISAAGCVRETAAGFAIGGGLVVIQVALMATFSYYQVESTGSFAILLHALFSFGIGALLQELFFRGILFRNLEELFGSWLALIIIALIFGIIHMGNENSTVWTSVALVISDVLLTAAFMLTRRIWLVWGIHAGWNYLQDGVFGMPNSGIASLKSWIASTTRGPEWLTGGSFGIEASLFAVVLSIAVAVILLRKAVAANQVIRPSWYREQPVASK